MQFGAAAFVVSKASDDTVRERKKSKKCFIRDQSEGNLLPALEQRMVGGVAYLHLQKNMTMDVPSDDTLKGNLFFTKRGRPEAPDK